MVELLVGEIEPTIKQSPYLPLTDSDEEDFVTDNPLLDKNFDDHQLQKEDRVNDDLTVDKEQENSTTLEDGIQPQRKQPLFQLGILKSIFSIFKTTLTKDKWLQYPTEQYALIWCLRSLKVIHRNNNNYEITF